MPAPPPRSPARHTPNQIDGDHVCGNRIQGIKVRAGNKSLVMPQSLSPGRASGGTSSCRSAGRLCSGSGAFLGSPSGGSARGGSAGRFGESRSAISRYGETLSPFSRGDWLVIASSFVEVRQRLPPVLSVGAIDLHCKWLPLRRHCCTRRIRRKHWRF